MAISIVEKLAKESWFPDGVKFSLQPKGQRHLYDEEHKSFIVDLERDRWYWNSKKYSGDAIGFLMRFQNMEYPEAKKKVDEIKATGIIKPKILLTDAGIEYQPYFPLVDIFWEAGKNNREYWYKRGITDYTIDRFKLGFGKGGYTIPIHENNRFVDFQVRVEKMRDGVLEKYPSLYYGGRGSKLFNKDILEFSKRFIVITEAPTDALLCLQNGIPAVSDTSGGKWKNEWFKYFTHIEKIYCLTDNDEPGRKSAKNIAEHLGVNKSFIYTFWDFREKYDLGDWFLDHPGKSLLEFIQPKVKRSFEL